MASDKAAAITAAPTQTGPAVTAGKELVSRFPTVLLLAVLVVLFSITTSSFMTSENLTTLVNAQAVTACLTFAAIVPLLVGEFDLSIGYAIGVVVAVGGYLAGEGWSTVPLIAAMIAAGSLIGLVNGILTVKFKVSAFISTLGVGIIVSGFTDAITGGSVLFKGIPESIISIGRNNFLGLGIAAWLTLVLAAILVYVLEYTPLGRRWYAIGGNERVAFLAGVKTDRLRILAFVAAGLLVSIGAVFALGKAGAANPGFGPELLLPAYAGAFLSVVAFRPGFFNVPGALIAVLLLAVGFNGLTLFGVPFWVQPVFNGVVLLVAVLGARAESRHLKVG